MAVMTQVHISRARYAHLKNSYSTAAALSNVSRRILTQVRTETDAQKTSEQMLIREEMNALLADAKPDMAYADLQNAYANIYALLGIDPFPANAAHQPARQGDGWPIAREMRLERGELEDRPRCGQITAGMETVMKHLAASVLIIQLLEVALPTPPTVTSRAPPHRSKGCAASFAPPTKPRYRAISASPSPPCPSSEGESFRKAISSPPSNAGISRLSFKSAEAAMAAAKIALANDERLAR